MFSSLHDPRARSINVLERFFFFIDRVHLGVPNGKRVSVVAANADCQTGNELKNYY